MTDRTTGRTGPARRAASALVLAGSAGAVALTAHTAVNLRLVRVPPADPPPVRERVSVLLPVRDEAHQVGACVRALLASAGVPDLEVLVLDDGSSDGTADAVRAAAGGDPRVRVLVGQPLPRGWLGKPHACQQLADAATGSALVFVDADVRVEPHGVAASVALLRSSGLDLVSPYPRQLAVSAGERLVQPLLQWSWMTTLPLRLAETSPRESLVAANGQLLVVDAEAHAGVGGHAAVRHAVLDDVALLRAYKRAGRRGVVVDGTRVATCRMYESWQQVRDGYAKSLHEASGSPAAAAATAAALGLLYVVPPVAALAGSRAGAVGAAAGVLGRALVARRVGGRVLPDSAAHPASVLALAWLMACSWRDRRRGALAWKGRRLVP